MRGVAVAGQAREIGRGAVQARPRPGRRARSARWRCRGRCRRSGSPSGGGRTRRRSAPACRPSGRARSARACSAASPSARSPAGARASPRWFACVSKPSSDTRTTATPDGLAMSCAAVRIALPNAAGGKLGRERVRRRRGATRACTMSRSTFRMCASAALRGSPARLREPRAAQELLGIGERDGARAAAGERARARSSRRSRRRRRTTRARAARERAREPAVLQVLVAACDAVSQISIERKCDRLGSGIAHALHDREPPVLPQRQQRRERRMQADAIGRAAATWSRAIASRGRSA